jgi:hypothetical protein
MREDGTVDLARPNELILTFGAHHKAAIHAEKRATAASPLFDLPRRSLLGWFLKLDHTASFMREVAEVVTPEEIGRRMKQPGMRPSYMQHFLLFQDMLGARQQRMLELGLAEGQRFPAERLDDLLFVADCDFFGGLVTDPLDFTDRIERFAVLTNESGVVRALPPASWPDVVAAATDATNEIYFDVVGWEPEMRVGYGAMLFANHPKPFLDLAGIDADDRLAKAAAETLDRYLDEVLAGPAVPLMFVHWTAAEGHLDWPVAA